MPTAYELDNVADRLLTMDEALDLDQQKLDVLHASDVSGEVQRFLRYEAALCKIAGWKGYTAHMSQHFDSGEVIETLTEYEEGANDMLATLQAMATEALS